MDGVAGATHTMSRLMSASVSSQPVFDRHSPQAIENVKAMSVMTIEASFGHQRASPLRRFGTTSRFLTHKSERPGLDNLTQGSAIRPTGH